MFHFPRSERKCRVPCAYAAFRYITDKYRRTAPDRTALTKIILLEFRYVLLHVVPLRFVPMCAESKEM